MSGKVRGFHNNWRVATLTVMQTLIKYSSLTL